MEYENSASGGMPPYGYEYNPPSGSLFGISDTQHTVNCTATDGASAEVSCTFFVQVNGKCLSLLMSVYYTSNCVVVLIFKSTNCPEKDL